MHKVAEPFRRDGRSKGVLRQITRRRRRGRLYSGSCQRDWGVALLVDSLAAVGDQRK